MMRNRVAACAENDCYLVIRFSPSDPKCDFSLTSGKTQSLNLLTVSSGRFVSLKPIIPRVHK